MTTVLLKFHKLAKSSLLQQLWPGHLQTAKRKSAWYGVLWHVGNEDFEKDWSYIYYIMLKCIYFPVTLSSGCITSLLCYVLHKSVFSGIITRP